MLVQINLLFALLSALTLVGSTVKRSEQQQQQSNSNQTNPYWKRPGCYRVGHTRTISIPGCVKFNLSTNACRGYCMSYSIPMPEEHGLSGADSAGLSEVSLFSDDSRLDLSSSSQMIRHRLMDERPVEFSNSLLDHKRHSLDSSSSKTIANGFQAAPSGAEQMMVGQMEMNGAPKRDVVSVSQCCSMLDTEDVVINLRCGASEIRRLVFKSAKSCECFFCKHV